MFSPARVRTTINGAGPWNDQSVVILNGDSETSKINNLLVKSQFGLASSSIFASVHDITDPHRKSWPSFIIDGLTNADEIHKMFPSKHKIECFENDTMYCKIWYFVVNSNVR